MSTTSIMDEKVYRSEEQPGAVLAAARLDRGFTPEYVAGKLHLRVTLILLLESDEYEKMPEPVFIRGYLRAYAKLLGIPVEPLLKMYNNLEANDPKADRALWQSKRETNRAERAIRWLTGSFGLIVLVAVTMWWYSNKDNERLFSKNINQNEVSMNKSQTEIRLTDLSKMRSLLSSTHPEETQMLEKEGD